VIGVLVGLVSTVLAIVGMGVQKRGSPALRRLREVGASAAVRRLLAWWLLGSAMTVSGSLLLFVALGLGRASVIGTLEGVGLVALALYAARVLGEPLTRVDARAIALVAVGTGLAGGAHAAATGGGGGISWPGLVGLAVGVATLGGVAVVLGTRTGRLGLALGGLAGATAGLTMAVQKVVGGMLVGAEPLAALTSPWALLYLGGAAAGFALTQLAYLHGRALDVVPAYASLGILVPVLSGPLVFGEPFPPLAGLGLLLLLVGVVELSRQGPVAATLRATGRDEGRGGGA
jgi:small multidrug resistance pump